MVLMAAQARGPMDTLSCPTVSTPAGRRERRKDCVDVLSREKDALEGTHDIRRAIPTSGVDGVEVDRRVQEFTSSGRKMRFYMKSQPQSWGPQA